jgi:hypothetical protein
MLTTIFESDIGLLLVFIRTIGRFEEVNTTGGEGAYPN